jgi:hypothetical protein
MVRTNYRLEAYATFTPSPRYGGSEVMVFVLELVLVSDFFEAGQIKVSLVLDWSRRHDAIQIQIARRPVDSYFVCSCTE